MTTPIHVERRAKESLLGQMRHVYRRANAHRGAIARIGQFIKGIA